MIQSILLVDVLALLVQLYYKFRSTSDFHAGINFGKLLINGEMKICSLAGQSESAGEREMEGISRDFFQL